MGGIFFFPSYLHMLPTPFPEELGSDGEGSASLDIRSEGESSSVADFTVSKFCSSPWLNQRSVTWGQTIGAWDVTFCSCSSWKTKFYSWSIPLIVAQLYFFFPSWTGCFYKKQAFLKPCSAFPFIFRKCPLCRLSVCGVGWPVHEYRSQVLMESAGAARGFPVALGPAGL